jgi:hypothetical protein
MAPLTVAVTLAPAFADTPNAGSYVRTISAENGMTLLYTKVCGVYSPSREGEKMTKKKPVKRSEIGKGWPESIEKSKINTNLPKKRPSVPKKPSPKRPTKKGK